MRKSVKLIISSGSIETDAPTVDDLIDQLRDYFDVLKSVEGALSESGGSVIDWRVVGATRNSPLAFEVEAYPRDYAVNIDRRAELTVQHTAWGLNSLQTSPDRPPYFTEKALEKAERFFERVMNGLNLTTVDHGDKLPAIVVTRDAARVAARNTGAILKPTSPRPYKEVGSLEGTFQRVESDGWGHPLLFIRHRLTGDSIKCAVFGEAREKVEQHLIAEIWQGRRIEVFGTIHYKNLGVVKHVDALDVKFLRSKDQLPQMDDIEDENFTGGLRSEDYLEKLHDGKLS